ncbi:MAG: DNA-directed RNA polymerase subunit E'' [Candidatus Woesearchaeota archaeon]|nr:MAG: DNA-directed RNA polymerase subunit E'' [Candidatus Woesearchaeota archaeon]
MKKKACRNDKALVEGDVCPLCKKQSLATNWQGFVYIHDAKESLVAQEMGITVKGEYAIKVK